MEKEKIINTDNENKDAPETEIKSDDNLDNEKDEVVSSEDKIKNLEDKLSRTLAEMENQRRRFEKERDDAFEYGRFFICKRSFKFN